MSRIISNLLLTIALFPTAIALAACAAVVGEEVLDLDEEVGIPLVAVVTLLFAYIYWTVVWWTTVRWTAARRFWTLLSVYGSLGAGALCGALLAALLDEGEVAFVFGAFIAAVAWMIFSACAWRETGAERAARARMPGGGAYQGPLLCPKCGYNMRGLTQARCPECGTEYTLDALLAANVERALPERELAVAD
ncbi:MAG: hypothetical protein GX591_11820 [Planctomycetes bacterium]|nr:hypothetical protein [Planctomycetota bacterium]